MELAVLPASLTLTPLKCNPVFPDRPWPSSLIQPPGTPRSKELNPHSLLNRDFPAQPSPVVNYGADSSPLLDWNGLENGYGVSPERGRVGVMVHPMSTHLKGGPQTSSEKR